jgi:hypothetical protein
LKAVKINNGVTSCLSDTSLRCIGDFHLGLKMFLFLNIKILLLLNRRIVVSDDVENIRKEAVVASTVVSYLEGLKKTMKNASYNSRSSDRESEP